MTFTLKSLPKFKKKTAKKINDFKKFKPDKDQLLIDDAFSGNGDQSITFADTKAEAKKPSSHLLSGFTIKRVGY